jgi:hypothetical protein
MKFLEILLSPRKQRREFNLSPDPSINLVMRVFESVVAQERDDDVVVQFDPDGLLLTDLEGTARPYSLRKRADIRDLNRRNVQKSPNIVVRKPGILGSARIHALVGQQGIPDLQLFVNMMGFNDEVWRNCGETQLLRETNIHVTGANVTEESAAEDARRNNIARVEALITLGIALISDADQSRQVAKSKPALFDRSNYPNGGGFR